MRTVRRATVLGAVLLVGSVLPATVASGQTETETESSSLGGFHGFSSFETHAQAHVASLVGYLNTFREENRLVGALSEINGPPANSRNIAGMVQRGEGATFIYGVIGGGGGERGTLPDPPPGEAGAFYPTEPLEQKWEGPITAIFDRGETRTFDGRAYAAASDTPTGRSEAAATHMDVPNYFTVEAASSASHTEPVGADEGAGVAAEAVSVLRGLTVGPLRIQSLTSTATAFVPAADGVPKGVATTVVEGATVNDTPVTITDKGVLVDKQATPGSQAQVNDALKGAGLYEVRLLASTAAPGADKQSVVADAGALSFVQYDEKFGASNPQGFSGGGFTVGGANAKILAKRCVPECPGTGGGGLGAPPGATDSGTGSDPGGVGYSAPDAGPAPAGQLPSFGANVAAAPAGVRTEAFAGAALPALRPTSSPSGAGGGYVSSGASTAATPSSLAEPAESRARVTARAPAKTAAAVVASPKFLRAMSLDEKSAGWMRDLYLAGGLGAGLLLVVPRLVRAFQ